MVTKAHVDSIFTKLTELDTRKPFQLGIHCTPSLEAATAILEDGLKLKPAVKSLDANMFRYGKITEVPEHKKSDVAMDNGSGRYVVLVGIPNEIGFQEKDYKGFNQDEMLTEADAMVFGVGVDSDIAFGKDIADKKLPKDFIVGYVDTETGNLDLNDKSLFVLPEKEREQKVEEYKAMLQQQKDTLWIWKGSIFGNDKIKWDPYNPEKKKEKEQAD